MRALMLACVALLALGLSGCLMSRTISDVVAHDTHNSYKVQTLSVYYAFFSAWQEWEVWNCHRDGNSYRCRELEYDDNQKGIARPESEPAPAPTDAPANLDTAAAPAEAEAATEAATEAGGEP
jgi:hypothetical protein